MFPNFVQGCPQEVGAVDPGDFDGVLEGHEKPFTGPIFGGHLQQVFSLVEDLSLCDVVGFVPGQDLGKGAFSRAVGSHHGVDFAGVYPQVDPAENVRAFDACVQVLNFEHAFPLFYNEG